MSQWHPFQTDDWRPFPPRAAGSVTVPYRKGAPHYYLGLDLGQSQDYTALAILERVMLPTDQQEPDPTTLIMRQPSSPLPAVQVATRAKTIAHYHLRHLERFPLGTSYPAVVARVQALLATPPLPKATDLVADATGVGAPVIDLLRQAKLDPVAITITGGDTVTSDGYRYSVPKRDLVSTLQVLLQSERLKVAAGLPEAPTLVKELLAFQVKLTAAAHDTYGAWREGIHDDLVLAVALACWYAEHPRPRFGCV